MFLEEAIFLKLILCAFFLTKLSICGSGFRSAWFKKIDGIDINENHKKSFLIEYVLSAEKTRCLGKCLIDHNCLMVILIEGSCSLYNREAKPFLKCKPENIGNVYMKKEKFWDDVNETCEDNTTATTTTIITTPITNPVTTSITTPLTTTITATIAPITTTNTPITTTITNPITTTITNPITTYITTPLTTTITTTSAPITTTNTPITTTDTPITTPLTTPMITTNTPITTTLATPITTTIATTNTPITTTNTPITTTITTTNTPITTTITTTNTPITTTITTPIADCIVNSENSEEIDLICSYFKNNSIINFNVIFLKQYGIDVIEKFKQTFLIISDPSMNILQCQTECALNDSCLMAIMHFFWSWSICKTYSKEARNYLESKIENVGNVYVKKEIQSIKNNCYALNNEISNNETHIEGLINYWPINGSVTDTFSKYNMSMTGNYKLENDRFNNSQSNPDSALHVYSGHAALPSGVYIDPSDGGFTIMTWVKILSKKSTIKVFGFGNHYSTWKHLGSEELSLWITFYSTGLHRMYIKYTNINAAVIWNGRYVSLIELNVWTHLTISIYGEYASIYENGIRSTPAWRAGFQYQRNVRTKNEIFTEVSGYEWDGMIDEFKIFNRSLSPIEIATEMNVLNILNINSTFSKESSLVNYKDRLTHYWPLNGTLKDLIGHKDIPQTNEVSKLKVCGFTRDRFGNNNSSFHMDGICHATLPSAFYFEMDKGFTIMFWMKIRELQNSRLIWFQKKAADPRYFYLYLSNPGSTGWWYTNPEKSTKLGVRMCKKNSLGYRTYHRYESEETLSLHEWIHVALTVNKNSANLYINGKIMDDFYSERFDLSQYIYYGIQESNYIGPGDKKDGIDDIPYIDINELKIFDCPLNNQQISAEANFIQKPSDTLLIKTGQITDSKELTHFWPIQNGSTKDEIDSKGNHLALHGDYSFGRDRFFKENSALEFRQNVGGIGYAMPPTDIYFDSSTGGFTIMFWVKYTGIHSGFFSFGTGNGLTNRIAMGMDEIQMWLLADKKYHNLAKISSPETNSWTHIALTMETSTLLTFVDGVPVDIWEDVKFYKAERYDNYIGSAHPPGSSQVLDGSIDEFKIFNRSLNANEIVTEMNILNLENQDSSFLVDKVQNYTKVLAHYWPLNGTAKDYAGNKDASTDNYGIYKTCGYTSDRFCIPNSALHMDGKCFLMLPSANYFKTEQGYTIMFWIKLRSIHNDQYILEFGDSSRYARYGDRPYLYFRFNGESSQILVNYYDHKANIREHTFQVLSKNKILTSQIEVNKWAHIAFTAGTNVGTLYINGIIEDSLAQISQSSYLVNMNYENQTINYIGSDFRSSNSNDQFYERYNLNADLDELKMFNKPLDQHRIVEEMNHDDQNN